MTEPPASRHFAVRTTKGFTDSEREAVALLMWQAFRTKLSTALNPEPKALRFIAAHANPEFALCARDEDGALIGLAGFKTAQGALMEGTLRDMSHEYGWFGAIWRGTLLGLLERRVEPGTLLMDGICVAPDARGRGVGTVLLDAIKDEARALGLSEIRLDVISTNPRARALYERHGFVAGAERRLGLLRYLLGFSSSLEMRADTVRRTLNCRDAAN